jgi:prepilin-type N-terminal cleavage/methylation domain-containing protein
MAAPLLLPRPTMKTIWPRVAGTGGFSLIEMMVVVMVVGIMAAMATPQLVNAVDRMRLGMSLRDVERELQFARLKAVSSNRPMRVRFDCPSAGRVRAVELIGTSAQPDAADADTNASRCNETTYPYFPTGADKSRLTRPNNDGAVRYLSQGTTFTAKQTLEFWPNGTVHTACQAACDATSTQIGMVTLTLLRKGQSKDITVNGLGKILLDR